MTKYPFTPEGVQQMQLDMYALPDAQLKIEAQEILTAMPFWVEAHFELAPHQVAYLNSLNSAVKMFIAENASLAMEYRRPSNLLKSPTSLADPEPDPEDEDKLIRPKPKMTVTGNNQGGFEVGGELDIEIFRLV